ncbi:MAG TPA: Smr/MutS family protein [Chitinivibrionales bacterium]|nr:Smr/MutS family protein [Chitinivibrionales bacterium]
MPDPSSSRKTILDHLTRYGVLDKDAMAQNRKQQRKSGIQKSGKRKFRMTLDLHGMTSPKAMAALREAVNECSEKGIAELLVIHGYGLHSAPAEGGVLKTAVKQYIEAINGLRVRSFTTAAPKNGGEGATLVRF